jgi:hypothetical protein
MSANRERKIIAVTARRFAKGAPGGRIPAGFLIESIPSTGITRVESQSFSEGIEWGFSGWSEA